MKQLTDGNNLIVSQGINTSSTESIKPSTRSWTQIFFIGQLISVLLTGTSVFTFMLVNHRPTINANATVKIQCDNSCNVGVKCQGINIPILQSTFSYLLLAFHLILRCQCNKNSGNKNRKRTRTRTISQTSDSYYSVEKLWKGNKLEIDEAIAREIDADFGRISRSNSSKTDSDCLLIEQNRSSSTTAMETSIQKNESCNRSFYSSSLSNWSSTHPHSKNLTTRYSPYSPPPPSSSSSSLSSPSLSITPNVYSWFCCNYQTTSVPLWNYLLVSFADVFANYLIVKAYQDTSLTSAMLLDSFALPFCAVLSYCFLGVRYTKRHFIGVLLCIVGLILNVVSDTDFNSYDNNNRYINKSFTPSSSTSSCGVNYPNALRGDMYVLIAAALYAVSNVAQEKLVKHYDRVEFLGMLGSFGTVLCVVILITLEREELSIFLCKMDYISTLELIGFVGCLFVMYCVTSKFLQEGDALLFNLSTLTSDIYGAALSVLLFNLRPHWLYCVAFIFVFFGILVYGEGGQHNYKEPLIESSSKN